MTTAPKNDDFTKRSNAVGIGSIAWLATFLLHSEPGNDSLRATLGQIDNASNHLRKMNNYRGVIPFLIETAKKKGVRLEEKDFDDPNIECRNEDVVIFRGEANKILDRLFEGSKCRSTTQKMGHRNLRFCRSPIALTNFGGLLVKCLHVALHVVRKIAHRFFRANEKS